MPAADFALLAREPGGLIDADEPPGVAFNLVFLILVLML